MEKIQNLFKKIIINLSFLFCVGIFLMLNIGAKYPTIESKPPPFFEELGKANMERDLMKTEYEKYVKLYQDLYEKSLIQQIEFEAEIVIPVNFDFKYVEYTYKLSTEFNISARVVFRLMFKESSFNDKIISKAGAIGLMQLMPDTRATLYEKFRIDTLNLDKNQEDIYIGMCYLKDLQEFWRKRGNPEKNLLKLSIGAYNSGPEPVIRYRGIPPYKETIDFVTFILQPHSNPTFYANIIKKNKNKDIV